MEDHALIVKAFLVVILIVVGGGSSAVIDFLRTQEKVWDQRQAVLDDFAGK